MTLELSSITRRKLVLVKSVYQQAVTDASMSYSSQRRLYAIIGFDWAIETILKTILKNLKPDTSLWNKKFSDLIGVINSSLKESRLDIPEKIPHRQNIDAVRDLRNIAQHSATIPSADDLNDCRVYVRDFLREIYADFWGENFEQFSLANAIEHVEIRNHLLDAETKLSEGKHYDAVFSATIAFNRGFRGYEGLHHMESVDLRIDDFAPPISTLAHAVDDLQATVKVMALGIEMSEYYRFKHHTTRLYMLPNGTLIDYDEGSREPYEENDAAFVVSFSTNSLLHMQECYGPLA